MLKVIFFSLLNLYFSLNIFCQDVPMTINDVSLTPIFVGGQSKLNEFVSQNFVTPEIEGISGLIKINFIIEIDGTLTNIKIIQNLGIDYEQAARNVFLKSPKWIPGELNGDKVRVLMSYPINIR